MNHSDSLHLAQEFLAHIESTKLLSTGIPASQEAQAPKMITLSYAIRHSLPEDSPEILAVDKPAKVVH
jgi:hypothetical protein